MCSVTFYFSKNYGGSNPLTFTGPQGVGGNLANGIDSLKVGDNSWLIVYSNADYGGDHLKLGPLDSKPNLDDVQRGSKGDWKNQIQSFVLYAAKPDFWDSSSYTPTIPLKGCELFITRDKDFLGGTAFYDKPVNEANASLLVYSDKMPGYIESLKTGDKAWLKIFNQPNYAGDSLKIYPNTTFDNMGSVARGSNGDWKNQVESFQLTDHLPAEWSLSFNLATFHSLFPDSFSDSTVTGASSGGPAIGYYTQDARYRIYDPVVSYPTTESMQVSLVIDHVIGMSTDDHVTLDIAINTDGGLDNVKYSWKTGGAYQIPDSFIEAVDATAELVGELEMLDSMGISEVEAKAFTEIFDGTCSAFNDISKLVNNWVENDGGRFYMIATVSHVINRVCASVVKS